MICLIRSRLTFALNQFFRVLETESSTERAASTIHNICQELVLVYGEWPIVVNSRPPAYLVLIPPADRAPQQIFNS